VGSGSGLPIGNVVELAKSRFEESLSLDIRRRAGIWSTVMIEFWWDGEGTGDSPRKCVLDDEAPVEGPVLGTEPRLTSRTASLIRQLRDLSSTTRLIHQVPE